MFRHLQEEPRWNADRRACSEEHAAAPVRRGGKDTRLSAFRFPFSFVRSPDEAQRNPGAACELHHRSRISLRFIRATRLSVAATPSPRAGRRSANASPFASRRSAWTTGLNPVVTRTWCCQPHWASLPPQSRINAANLDG